LQGFQHENHTQGTKATKAMDTMPTNVDEELFPLYEEVSDHCRDEIAGIWNHHLSMEVFL
jgi:hypothetical protein